MLDKKNADILNQAGAKMQYRALARQLKSIISH
jgi:hypothetical protein